MGKQWMALSLVVGLWPAVAGAAGGLAPMPAPDPATKTMNRGQIQARVLDACQITQARLQQTSRDQVREACQCYARGTVAGMSRADLQAFRDTSVFNDATRARALAEIDRCKLVRPI
jgi:hypothetical protein